MRKQEIEKLLGGYAAGTLTREEQDALFAAALEDQQLFEALAREEPLRELLADPVARGRLLASVAEGPMPWYYRPLSTAVIASAAAALVIFGVIVYWGPVRRLPDKTPREPFVSTVRPEPKQFDIADALRPKPVPSPIPTALPPPPPLPPVAVPQGPVLAEATSIPAPPEERTTTPGPNLLRSAINSFQPATATVSADRFGLHFTVLKKQPDGEAAEVEGNQEFDRSDEVMLRFQTRQSGYLYVLQQNAGKRWVPLFTGFLQPAMDYLVPPTGSFHAEESGLKELFVVFSLRPLANVNRYVTPVAEGQRVSFPITLRYK